MVYGWCSGKYIDFEKRVLSFHRNFATLDIFGYVTGLGEAGRQGTLRAECPLGKGLYSIAFKRMYHGLVWRNNGFFIFFYGTSAIFVTIMFCGCLV